MKLIENIKLKIENPKFFVFSDDIDYAKTMFGSLDDVVFASSKSRPAHIDMYFMSQCKHNIIANSTFSFWGAYLNDSSEKIVVCPDVWMPRLKYPLYCEGWIMIKDSIA